MHYSEVFLFNIITNIFIITKKSYLILEVGFFQRLIFNIIAYTVMIFIVANALRFYNENEYNECKTIILSIWSWFTKYLDMPQLQK